MQKQANQQFVSPPPPFFNVRESSKNLEENSPIVMLPPVELKDQSKEFKRYMREQIKKQTMVVTSIKNDKKKQNLYIKQKKKEPKKKIKQLDTIHDLYRPLPTNYINNQGGQLSQILMLNRNGQNFKTLDAMNDSLSEVEYNKYYGDDLADQSKFILRNKKPVQSVMMKKRLLADQLHQNNSPPGFDQNSLSNSALNSISINIPVEGMGMTFNKNGGQQQQNDNTTVPPPISHQPQIQQQQTNFQPEDEDDLLNKGNAETVIDFSKGYSTLKKNEIKNMIDKEMSPRDYIRSYYVHTKKGHILSSLNKQTASGKDLAILI